MFISFSFIYIGLQESSNVYETLDLSTPFSSGLDTHTHDGNDTDSARLDQWPEETRERRWNLRRYECPA